MSPLERQLGLTEQESAALWRCYGEHTRDLLHQLLEGLVEVLPDPVSIRSWLVRSHPHLHAPPLDLLCAGRAGEVCEVVFPPEEDLACPTDTSTGSDDLGANRSDS